MRPDEIRVITEWINRGAAWPDGIDDQADRLSLWSLRPIRRPKIPTVQDRAWAENPIDSFVLAQLDAREMTPSHGLNHGTLFAERHSICSACRQRRRWLTVLWPMGLPPPSHG